MYLKEITIAKETDPKVFHKTFFNVVSRADGTPAQSERRESLLTFPSQSNVSES